MKKTKIILFVSVIIIIIFTVFYKKSTEHFDNRIERLLETNCGTLCTNVEGCKSFGYDPNNNVCWISKNEIFKKPLTSLYSQDYNKKYIRCNKLQNIDDIVIANNSDYINNTIYECKQTEDSETKTYNLYTENTVQIDELANLQKTDINKYKISELEWPNVFNPLDYSDIKTIIYPDKKNINIMREKYDEYLGDPLYEHECIANIEKKDCLTSCFENINCKGVEHNSSFVQNNKQNNQSITYKNVCCPKKNINKIISRRDDFINGKFYLKDNIVISDVMAENNSIVLI
jgi:hypothetical protein